MRHALLTVAVGALLASTSCAGTPAHEPSPAPGPRVTTDGPSHPRGVEVALR